MSFSVTQDRNVKRKRKGKKRGRRYRGKDKVDYYYGGKSVPSIKVAPYGMVCKITYIRNTFFSAFLLFSFSGRHLCHVFYHRLLWLRGNWG